MKQARARSIRRRQEKEVHIYHCVTSWTIEVDILEFRTGRRIVVEGGSALGRLKGKRLAKAQLGGDQEEVDVDVGGVASIVSEAEVWRALDESDMVTMITAMKSGTWSGKGKGDEEDENAEGQQVTPPESP